MTLEVECDGTPINIAQCESSGSLSARRIGDEKKENGTNLLDVHRHLCCHHLQENAQPTVWSANKESARGHGQEDAARHDTIMRIAVKRKCGIKLYEVRRGSATVQSLAECKK